MSDRSLSLRALIYSIWAILMVIGICDLRAHAARSLIWFGSVLVLMSVYFSFRRVPLYIHLLLAIVALLNLMGELLLGFYYTWEFYDKLLHAAGSLILCLFLYRLFERKLTDERTAVLLSAAAALSIAAIWEMMEYLFYKILSWKMLGAQVGISLEDRFFGAQEQIEALDRLHDTMIDMVSNILGILGFIAGHFLYRRRKSLTRKSRVV